MLTVTLLFDPLSVSIIQPSSPAELADVLQAIQVLLERYPEQQPAGDMSSW